MGFAGDYSKKSEVFAEDSTVELDENGLVRRGILAEDSELPYQTNKYITFAEDTRAEFIAAVWS